jgi:hypothetical protein
MVHKEPVRVAIYVCPTDIPGIPQDRQNKVAQLFCDKNFSRPFNPTLNPVNYDFSHALPGFDSDTRTKIWFLVDLNVTSRLDGTDLLNIPHQAYLLSKQADEWYESRSIHR